MEDKHGVCWDDLPVEIQDVILHYVVKVTKVRKRWHEGEKWRVMEVVLPFVCRAWKERKPFWRNVGFDAVDSKESWTSMAAAVGSFSLMKWLREKGVPWDATTCCEAAKQGNLEMLEWLRENRCSWQTRTCAAAALGGHFEVLKWLRANGCSWDG